MQSGVSGLNLSHWSPPTFQLREFVQGVGLGIGLLGLVGDIDRKLLRSLSTTKPSSSIPKPGEKLKLLSVVESLKRR